jgi:hypothetical protein
VIGAIYTRRCSYHHVVRQVLKLDVVELLGQGVVRLLANIGADVIVLGRANYRVHEDVRVILLEDCSSVERDSN